MKIKKIISLMLMAVVTVSMLALPAAADTSGKNSDFTIYYGVLSKYKGAGGAVTIPSGVTSISDYAFYNCASVTSVVIPSSVTSIGDYAFEDCSGLSNISVDATSLDYSAVNGVLFNKDKTELIQYPLGNAKTAYSIPNGVTSIAKSAFMFANLTSITIPESVTSIGETAFSCCNGLTIYGVDGSYAQTFAKAINVNFSIVTSTDDSSTAIGAIYSAYVQSVGWQPFVYNGAEAGTEGKALRVEALRVSLTGDVPKGASVIYQTYVQRIGWQKAVSDAAEAGTDGKSLRVEALRLTISGMPGYEVQYRAYVQGVGWQKWHTTANGTDIADSVVAGTTGQSKRIEAVEILTVKVS